MYLSQQSPTKKQGVCLRIDIQQVSRQHAGLSAKSEYMHQFQVRQPAAQSWWFDSAQETRQSGRNYKRIHYTNHVYPAGTNSATMVLNSLGSGPAAAGLVSGAVRVAARDWRASGAAQRLRGLVNVELARPALDLDLGLAGATYRNELGDVLDAEDGLVPKGALVHGRRMVVKGSSNVIGRDDDHVVAPDDFDAFGVWQRLDALGGRPAVRVGAVASDRAITKGVFL